MPLARLVPVGLPCHLRRLPALPVGRSLVFTPIFSQRMLYFFRSWCLGALLLLASLGAAAQASRPVAYEFMTISIVKSPYKNDCYMLLTPAFQGKAEIKLDEEYNLASDRYRANLQRNTVLLTTTLGELSAAGWELSPRPPSRGICCEKPKAKRLRISWAAPAGTWHCPCHGVDLTPAFLP